MVIHAVGDSHSLIFKDLQGAVVHYLGPILSYSVGAKPFEKCNISSFNLQNDDTLIFCFGEIDCRCQVHKFVSHDRPVVEVIRDLVKAYVKGIQALTSSLNLKIWVYNVLPPINKHRTSENPEYPFRGSDEERKLYVETFNRLCKEECLLYGYGFLDVYKDYSNEEGMLNFDLSDGHVHIKDSSRLLAYLQQFVV